MKATVLLASLLLAASPLLVIADSSDNSPTATTTRTVTVTVVHASSSSSTSTPMPTTGTPTQATASSSTNAAPTMDAGGLSAAAMAGSFAFILGAAL